MKIKKVELITEVTKIGGIEFVNTTEDQFPYIESAISKLDSNLNWWKENWELIEKQLINAYKKLYHKNSNIKIRTYFTIYNGVDEVSKDIKWNGPAIEYTFIGADFESIQEMKKYIGNILEGHKVFYQGNTITILFG
jgi:hypothetical protein